VIATPHHVARHSKSGLPHWLIHLGALGVFGVAIIDASPIPLPLPGSTDLLLLLLVAHRGNPFVMAGSAIAGSLIGGYLSWKAGSKGGEAMLQRVIPQRFLKRITGWVQRHGIMSVVAAGLCPPPIPLSPFLLAASALGMSRGKFLGAFGAARVVRYSLVAWLGATYGRRVVQLWSRELAGWSDVILWIFFGFLAAAIVFGIWKYRRQGRRVASRDLATESAGAR
jgi:membrane protein YqaA with SNARE-associated domain